MGIGFSRSVSNPVEVSVPSGFSVTPPFDIYKDGNSYYADPQFDLETYANISVTKTYYVDSVSGSDSNTGLSWAQAFATLSKIQSQGDADLVYIAENSYFQKNQRTGNYTRNIKFIGVGTNKPKITADVNNQTGAFSVHSGDCYVANIGEYIAYSYDKSNLTFGNPTGLEPAASIAACVATPNTFFTDWPNTDVYVHLFDGREPDSDLIVGDSTCLSILADNRTQYWENIEFGSGISLDNASATGGLNMYFKNCTFQSATIFGLDEFIAQDCVGSRYINAGDVFNYDAANGIATTAYEANCNLSNNELGAGNNQASTTHNGCTIVRIGGEYHNNAGQAVADVLASALSGGQTWMLGCELYESNLSDVGCYFNIDSAWLDGVYIHDLATGLQNEASNTIYFTNLRNQATLATELLGNYYPYGLPQFIATGGTISTDGDFTIHKFNSSDTLNITSCPNNMELTMLVIAGGGGGGELGGGGGGAGGLIYKRYYPISAGAKSVVIGAGGLGAEVGSPYTAADSGENTTFNGLTAIGGGGGAGNQSGVAGGSGGGGGGFNISNVGGTGTVGQGTAGGAAGVANGGGGGGAGGAGTAGDAGTRGAGLAYTITGASVTYARGGAGSGATGNSTNGAANLGEGGGGNYLNGPTGNGGSGVVIIRYKTPI
jgi:hypothetical protein